MSWWCIGSRCPALDVVGLRGYRRAFYAGSRKRTSQNLPSTHSDEQGQEEEEPRFRLDDRGEAVALAVAIVVDVFVVLEAFVPDHPDSEMPRNTGRLAALRKGGYIPSMGAKRKDYLSGWSSGS
jgi:hypothetical protein